jgi:transposase
MVLVTDRRAYPIDLLDAQLALIELWLSDRGRPRTSDLWEVVNAVLYLLRTGFQ